MLLEDIELLISNDESSIYIGEAPIDSPNNTCALSSVGGRSPQHVLGQKKAIFRQPTIQVLIRDISYQNGEARAQNIVDILDGHTDVSSGILNVFLEGDIVPIGRDEKNRAEFTILFRLMINQ